ncbi:MAG: hypothetical protein N3B13_07125, partial [Deltaproteobacteria bacterium]|nr:hypothetical protein [Deltaproteobacteria bacterium]
MVKRLFFIFIISLFAADCGVESLLFSNISNAPSDPGSVENRIVAGMTTLFRSGTADLISSTGESIAVKSGNIESDGKFMIEVSSKIDINNAIVMLRSGNRVLLDIFPQLKKATTIEESRSDSFRVKVIENVIDEKTTAYTILAAEKLRKMGSSLSAVSFCAIKNAKSDVFSKFEQNSESAKFLSMVSKIISAGSESGSDIMFDIVSFLKNTSSKSVLSEDFLRNNEVKYSDGDNKSVEPFEIQLEKSANEFEFIAKYDETRLATVITANINEGLTDSNGNTINPYKWATKKEGAKMYIALGIHKESPVQDEKLNQEVFILKKLCCLLAVFMMVFVMSTHAFAAPKVVLDGKEIA